MCKPETLAYTMMLANQMLALKKERDEEQDKLDAQLRMELKRTAYRNRNLTRRATRAYDSMMQAACEYKMVRG